MSLTPQKKTETERIVSKHISGGMVSWDPSVVRFNGPGVFINGAQVNPFTQMPINTPETTITKEIWVDFIFDHYEISVINLIRVIKERLSVVVRDIYFKINE